jgi:tRNA uridine 5-carboxymethylaminomethyl modification enzyme
VNAHLAALGTSAIVEDVALEKLLKRPGVTYALIKEISPPSASPGEEAEKLVETEVKYLGYIRRQMETAERLRSSGERSLPESLDYRAIPGLSNELVGKLEEVRPSSIGQAERIPGMTPAALSLLVVAAERARRCRG